MVYSLHLCPKICFISPSLLKDVAFHWVIYSRLRTSLSNLKIFHCLLDCIAVVNLPSVCCCVVDYVFSLVAFKVPLPLAFSSFFISRLCLPLFLLVCLVAVLLETEGS